MDTRVSDGNLKAISLSGSVLALVGFFLIATHTQMALGILAITIGLIMASVIMVAFTLRIRLGMSAVEEDD